MVNKRSIHDSIYGTIELEDNVSDIVSTREFQRMNMVKQLGFTYLVFPGATHSRFEHSLGTYYLANEASKRLGLGDEDVVNTALSGLLHDIGHSPFSHALEESMVKIYGKDHVDVTIDIIEGKTPDNEISDILGEHKKSIVSILKGDRGVLSRIISGNGDVDQIDYLARDSYYTGVALGAVDIPRIMRVLSVSEDRLCVEEKGLPAVEGLMVARMLMYRTVYRHKTALIASTLANDALLDINPDYDEFVQWNDCDFVAELKKGSNRTYEALKRRRLPKGFITMQGEEEFLKMGEELSGHMISSQYFRSPFKKEVLDVLTGEGVKPITDFSSIMEFLERELVGMGLIIFDSANEKELKKTLKNLGIATI